MPSVSWVKQSDTLIFLYCLTDDEGTNYIAADRPKPEGGGGDVLK